MYNIFQISAAILLSLVINFFGKISKKLGYTNLSDPSTDGLFGFNLIFRILAPVVYISFFSIIMYFLGFNGLVKNIWLVSVWYFLFNIIIIFCIGQFPLIDKKMYFSVNLLSMMISYWIYTVSLSRGLNFILPEANNFRTEIWFIIILFFYSILNNYEPSNERYYKRKDSFLEKRYKVLHKKYEKYLDDDFINNIFLEKLLFSMMITEDINRNKFIRFIEKIFWFFGITKTTGIMQVNSTEYLSDEKSIKLAQKIIKKSFEDYFKDSKSYYELSEKIINKYNPGYEYFDSVKSVFYTIDKDDFLYKEFENTKKAKLVNSFIETKNMLDVINETCKRMEELIEKISVKVK